MKREIKFRAWDAETDEMIYPHEGGYRPHHQWFTDENTIVYANMQTGFSTTEIMQFTGLKDKNKTPIYEGDIVTYKWEDRKGEEVVNHVIKWENGRFLMCPIRSIVQTWNIHLHPYNEEAEVIGNVYESPELVKP